MLPRRCNFWYWARVRRRTLTGLALGIAATAVVPAMSLDHFIFFPDRNVAPPPPGVVERWLTTADGVPGVEAHAVAPEGAATPEVGTAGSG